VTTQQDAYGGSVEITSDPFGHVSRANRNHRRKRELITEYTHAQAGDAILEVGCGHGIHASHYAERFQYTGVDVSASLCEETRTRVNPVSADARVDVADATRLPYRANTFDAVVGTAVLHHLAEQGTALAEWHRVTKPGGSVTLMEPNYLFPLAFATTHLVPEERHKVGMAPWRLRESTRDAPGEWEIEPYIYTPPWPERLSGAFDSIDEIGASLPVIRWASQMLLIHGRL
jgi:SAM-dependent methyltransferase